MSLVQMKGITKRFGGLLANDQIDLDIAENEIHALLGENGAGKSTLMKILYGLYQPDEGEIFIADTPVHLQSPADAIAHGIGLVSQHFSLVPSMTVAENVVMGFESGALISRNNIEKSVADTAKQFGFNVDPRAAIRNLSVGQQQRVEILKALYRRCRVLILDEPTAVLTPHDAESLFKILRELQQKQLSVVIITHKLEEVMAISQRVTVLRQGRVAGRIQTAETTPQELARMMVGRNVVSVVRNTKHQRSDQYALEVTNLIVTGERGVPALKGISFRVHAGEVLGIAGVAGNGQSELVSLLNGLIQPQQGEVRVQGQAIRLGDPQEFNRLKVARIPEDRLKAIIPDMSVADNLMLEQVDQFTRAGHLNRRKVIDHALVLIRDFQIKAQPGDRVKTLSGGNIQKVILARSLSQQPGVVIAAQPTRGLDIGATEYVHEKLLEQKLRGAGVLLVSEDLDETLLLSDRILVMYAGQIVGEFDIQNVDIDQISLLMAGSK